MILIRPCHCHYADYLATPISGEHGVYRETPSRTHLMTSISKVQGSIDNRAHQILITYICIIILIIIFSLYCVDVNSDVSSP